MNKYGKEALSTSSQNVPSFAKVYQRTRKCRNESDLVHLYHGGNTGTNIAVLTAFQHNEDDEHASADETSAGGWFVNRRGGGGAAAGSLAASAADSVSGVKSSRGGRDARHRLHLGAIMQGVPKLISPWRALRIPSATPFQQNNFPGTSPRGNVSCWLVM